MPAVCSGFNSVSVGSAWPKGMESGRYFVSGNAGNGEFLGPNTDNVIDHWLDRRLCPNRLKNEQELERI